MKSRPRTWTASKCGTRHTAVGKHLVSLKAKISPGHPFFEIIEDAYRVFEYPKPKSIEVCERCCMDANIDADFFNPPVRELPLEYVQDWFFASCDPNGIAKETWAYLLPRILEILASGKEVSNVGVEVSLNRFDTGNPENWSNEEWDVLDRFQRKFLDRAIDQDQDFLDDFVCMFRLAGWSLDELLNQVAAASDARLARRFWNDWCRWAPGRESIWITAFWKGPDNATVFDFYSSRMLHDRMTALALADSTEADLAAKAFAVASVIEASS
jgi:hypothetical protein